MTMTSGLRKFTLTAHITASVGWLGAVASFLALALVGLTSKDAQMVRTVYLAMELTAWYVIVPLAFASLITGLVQSLGTTWGLFRHYWIIAKFLITIFATILLLLHTRPIAILADAAREATFAIGNYRGLQVQLVGDAVAAIVLLLVATTLSVYKPWGMTKYGRRKQQERSKPQVEASVVAPLIKPTREPVTGTPRWVYVVGIHAIGLVLLFVVLHLTGRGLPGH
jgi:hypothetical protein